MRGVGRRLRTCARAIGITPVKLVAAGPKKIEAAIRDGGMQPPHRAAKVFASAQLALDVSKDEWGDRKVLKRFPGIADPGADKILLLCGFSDAPALDSNGLRVLERLHVVTAGTSVRGSLSCRRCSALRRRGARAKRARCVRVTARPWARTCASEPRRSAQGVRSDARVPPQAREGEQALSGP